MSYKTKKVNLYNLDFELKKFKPKTIVNTHLMGDSILIIYETETQPFVRDEEWLTKIKAELAESK